MTSVKKRPKVNSFLTWILALSATLFTVQVQAMSCDDSIGGVGRYGSTIFSGTGSHGPAMSVVVEAVSRASILRVVIESGARKVVIEVDSIPDDVGILVPSIRDIANIEVTTRSGEVYSLKYRDSLTAMSFGPSGYSKKAIGFYFSTMADFMLGDLRISFGMNEIPLGAIKEVSKRVSTDSEILFNLENLAQVPRIESDSIQSIVFMTEDGVRFTYEMKTNRYLEK